MHCAPTQDDKNEKHLDCLIKVRHPFALVLLAESIETNVMQHNPYIIEPSLDREQELALKNKRTGILIFQVSWIMAFVAFAMVNFQLRFTAISWPPPGVEKLNPLLPTLGTLGLLMSVFTVRRAVKAISYDNTRRMIGLLRLTLIFGGAFIGIMAYEWLAVKPVPQELMTLANGAEVIGPISQYNTVFRVMTAFHAVHALAIALFLGAHVLRRARQGAYSSADYWDVEAGAKLWYFVFVAWMIFYVVLYWI